ncbi:MAG: glycoside hydrolase family 127 protein, partial [Clostridia bacterium]|nr:glycoside hydrolase family 127 protein [Clostridia bacterium]
WAVLLIGKVLAVYASCMQDERAEQALYRTMKNLHDLLSSKTLDLGRWGRFRWFEGLIPLLHLMERRPEAWMTELGEILLEQGADYPSFREKWKRPLNQWTYETHIVNIAMMLKYEALLALLRGRPMNDTPEELWRFLTKYNGTAVGTLKGDECLSGLGNQQGTELCAVVEMMYSFEWLYSVSGDSVWADRLEKAAFNALPATFTEDMWAHQYDQMVNQVSCVPFPGKSFFRTNGSESHVFGLEPNYGCCTANMGQGWPKLAMRAVQKTNEGLVLAHLLPCSVHTDIGGQPVFLRIDSEYPFRLGADITVQAEDADFALSIRIPLWAREVLVNGKPVHPEEGHLKFQKRWHGTETLRLTLSDAPHLVSRPQGMQAAEYGPLVFSLPLQMKAHRREYVRDGVERKFPYCDWAFEPQSEWRFGFASPDLTVEERPLSATPFSMACPPVVLHAQLAPISWEWADGYDSVPSAVPASKQAVGPSRSMELIPYGHAKLRMTELPMAETDDPSQKNEHKAECPVIRGLSHIAVRAADLMKTVHFYTEVLGLPEAFRMTDDHGNVSTVYVYIAPSQFIEIFANGSSPPLSGQDVIGMCHICLETEDVEKAYATVKERGGPLDTDVRLGKSRCRMFWTHDPDGNALEIMELPPNSLQAKANARFASRS